MNGGQGAADGRLAALQAAVEALETAIRTVGIAVSDEQVTADYGREDLWRLAAEGGDATDPLARHAELTIAAARRLLGIAQDEFRGRSTVAATRTCFRSLPPADMHEIDGGAGVYWVCEHKPSHRG